MKRTSPNIHCVTYFPTVTKLLFSFLLACTVCATHAQSDDIKVVNSDRAEEDLFGRSVDISGNYAVVGAPYEDEDASGENTLSTAGSVYIYKKDAMGEWQELKKIVASDRTSPDQFGWSVAISGDLAVVGAWLKYEDNETIAESGAAYIFQKDQGGTDNWGEVTKIIPADRDDLDYFGISVDISSEYAVVGAYREDEDPTGQNTMNRAGSAYIFKRDEGGTDNWGELTKIVPDDRDADDEFGYSVAISGEYIVVGARQDEHDAAGANPMSSAGSAYIFQKDFGGTDNWGELKKLVASDRSSTEYFGWSLDISGDNILVGANGDGAYLFNKDEGGIDSWGEVQKILPANFSPGNRYGASVSISGDYVLIGSPEDDYDQNGENKLSSSGSAYLFKNEGDTWLAIQKLVSTDRASDDYFGSDVGITSSGEFIVGALYEDEDSDGNNTQNSAGAAYFFPSKSAQIITFDPLPSKSFGDASFDLSATSSSELPIVFSTANASTGDPQGEGQGPAPIVATVSGNTVTIVSTGTIDIIATQAGDDTYWSTSKTQKLVVNKVPLTVTVNDESRDYREANTDFTLSYQGFLEGDDENDLDFLPEISVNTHEESSAGEYPIEVSGGFDDIYDFNYVDGVLTINKLPLTITIDDYTRMYGDFNPEEEELDPLITYSGFIEGEDERVLDGDPVITIDADESSDVGNYEITLEEVTAENYSITIVDGSLTITQAPLTAMAEDQSRAYGEANPDLTFTYIGFVNGDDESQLDTAPMGSTNADQSSDVGTYSISASGGLDNNYAITHVGGTITVNPASLLIKADDKTINYGDATPEFTISYSGFVNGEDASVLLSQPSVSTEEEVIDAGTYTIGISGGSAENYMLTKEPGVLTINQALLTATADYQTINEGEALPEFTITYSGFVNEDDMSVIDTPPSISVSTPDSSTPGQFDIVMSGGVDDNYILIPENGILTINEVLGLQKENISIYPNPTIDYLSFSSSETFSVNIYDLKGSRVLSARVNGKVDVSNLQEGTYVVQLMNSNEELIYSGRIVKKINDN